MLVASLALEVVGDFVVDLSQDVHEVLRGDPLKHGVHKCLDEP